ncbi:MAG: ATP12 family protein, partial [Sphingomicrobium sp.]
MKRFWKTAAVVEVGSDFGVILDGKPLKTPARAALVVSTRPLADAIDAEWNDCG